MGATLIKLGEVLGGALVFVLLFAILDLFRRVWRYCIKWNRWHND